MTSSINIKDADEAAFALVHSTLTNGLSKGDGNMIMSYYVTMATSMLEAKRRGSISLEEYVKFSIAHQKACEKVAETLFMRNILENSEEHSQPLVTESVEIQFAKATDIIDLTKWEIPLFNTNEQPKQAPQ